MASRIPRRTREIELWDVNPIGNRLAWAREMAQFWALMLARGRLSKSLPFLFRDNEYVANAGRGRVPIRRPLTVAELAHLVAKRLKESPYVVMGDQELAGVESWLADTSIIPGERIRWLPQSPAAGLSIWHYSGLAIFNRSVTRQRYWASFFYSAVATDLDFGDLVSDDPRSSHLAGVLLDRFLGDGLLATARSSEDVITWAVDVAALAKKDPDLYLPALALASPEPDPLTSTATGMPHDWLTSAVASDVYDEFLCPGIVILLRRALRLLLEGGAGANHSALAELVETALANHAAFYYVRGMRVLNDLTMKRTLADDCASCWDRFQADLTPAGSSSRRERWAAGDYAASASTEDARWVETNCSQPNALFVNAGRKEQQNAKDLARMSLEDLRYQLSEYTVNRIVLKVAWDVAKSASGPTRPAPTTLRDVYSTLDAWYTQPETRLMMASLWRNKLELLRESGDVPGAAKKAAEDAAMSDDPAELEQAVRHLVGESILSTRAFGRYVEVLHSLLGGGALPTNQDPKGLVARGGTASSRFHLSINDRALEMLVAVASLEYGEQPLSFHDFIEFIARRYGLLVDRKPTMLNVAPGLVADAATESRRELRYRLTSMGFLTEFSDSSDWNRVRSRIRG